MARFLRIAGTVLFSFIALVCGAPRGTLAFEATFHGEKDRGNWVPDLGKCPDGDEVTVHSDWRSTTEVGSWTSLQDSPAWDKPDPVTDSESRLIPWHIREGAHGPILLMLGVKDENQSELLRYECRRGSWKKVWSADLGFLEGPPACHVTGKQIVLLLAGKNRTPVGIRLNLADGKAEKSVIKDTTIEEMNGDIRPSIARFGNSLYGVIARQRGTPRALHLLKSDDDGRTWVPTGPRGLSFAPVDGGRPLLFSIGNTLHLVLRESGASPEIRHYTSKDGNVFKEQETEFPNAGGISMPINVAGEGESVLLVYATQKLEGGEAVLRTLIGDRAGWKTGGDLMTTRLSHLSMFNTLQKNGRQAWYCGIAVDPKSAETPGVTVHRSQDGGKTWKDVGATTGLARINLFPVGGRVGNEFMLAFLNVASLQDLQKVGGFPLMRRFGTDLSTPPELSAAERKKVRDLVERLKSDDPEERDLAETALSNMGERILPELERIIDQVTDFDMRNRLGAVRKSLYPIWWKGRPLDKKP